MKTDLEIQQDVMAELKWQPVLNGAQIGVSVDQGVVMLSGIVDSYYKKVQAQKAAARVTGVKAVAEEIIVKVPGSVMYTDVDIAQAVWRALVWDSTIDENKIKIEVEKGEVTLEGVADWNFQKVSAQQTVEKLVGVTRIINNIRVINKVTAEDLHEKIAQAFERNAAIDAGTVQVLITGDKATLTGTVRSFSEKKEAEKVAWASPGVMEVQNDLQVDSQVDIY